MEYSIHYLYETGTGGVCITGRCSLMKVRLWIVSYTPHRSLRFSDSNFLVTPKNTTVTYGERSFAAIAPKLWNQPPLAIRQSNSVDSFKRALTGVSLTLVISGL